MSIISTIQALRRGAALETLDAEFRALVTSVRDTGRKGTLTLKLPVNLADKAGDDDMTLEVHDAVSVSLPKPPAGRTIMFATADGNLARHDPRQSSLLAELAAAR